MSDEPSAEEQLASLARSLVDEITTAKATELARQLSEDAASLALAGRRPRTRTPSPPCPAPGTGFSATRPIGLTCWATRATGPIPSAGRSSGPSGRRLPRLTTPAPPALLRPRQPGAGAAAGCDQGADCPRVQQTTQDEQLCVRCGASPAAFLVRPHGVAYCSECYLDGQRYAPELAATA